MTMSRSISVDPHPPLIIPLPFSASLRSLEFNIELFFASSISGSHSIRRERERRKEGEEKGGEEEANRNHNA